MAADITLVVPVWGTHVEFLPRAIASLLDQEGPSTQVVVVDNASDVPVTGLPPAVRLLRSPERLSVGAARNVALREVESPGVVFWDADDVLLPGALQRMWSVFAADPGLVAVTMDSVAWSPEAGPGARWVWPRPIFHRLSRRPRLFALMSLFANPFPSTGPALLRTEAVKAAGGFAEEVPVAEDWILASSLTVRGRVAMLRETGRQYRVHGASLTQEHLDGPGHRAWLGALRARIREDPAVPAWMKALLPLVRLAHWQKVRRRRRRRSGAGGGYYDEALTRFSGGGAPGRDEPAR